MRFNYLIRVFITLQILIAITSKAEAQQNWDTLPWKSYSDYKLQYLNKNYVSTNILYDRMFPLANVDEYTGLPYNTIGMISPDALDDLIKTNGNSKQHPIGVFLYKFNSLDTNALQDRPFDRHLTQRAVY